MAEEIRVGQVKSMQELLGERADSLQERYAGRVSQLWWNNPDAEEWELVEAFFLAPYPPLTREDVKKDPEAFSQALVEWLRCDRCTAKKAMVRDEKTGHTAGYQDCPLERYDAKNYYLDVELLGENSWHWVKRRCTTREHRALEIGRRLGTMKQIGGGLEGIEVCEEPPWHSQVGLRP